MAVQAGELTTLWDQLGEDDRDILVTLARALHGGTLRTPGVLALLPFATDSLRDAFLRLLVQPDTSNITLRFRAAGAAVVVGLESTGRAREEDAPHATRGAQR
jgi:hypothetical protein